MSSHTTTTTHPTTNDSTLDSAILSGSSVAPEETPEQVITNRKVCIVDDEPINIRVTQKHLERCGYSEFVTTTNPREACHLIYQEQPGVVLLDLMMPEVSGLDILRVLRMDDRTNQLPVLILTASTDSASKRTALELGATDFLMKPIDFDELIPRVRNALLIKAHNDDLRQYATKLVDEVRQRTHDLAQSRLDLVHRLARAAEYRDNETGRHVIRVGRYVEVIARAVGLDEETIELMRHAAPLHDVGKIAIPDAILLSPNKLTPEEYEHMKLHSSLGKKIFEQISEDEWKKFRQHPDAGNAILGGSDCPLLRMASRIAISHHEKWDGSGYPLALAGEDIPLEGRITAVADVFDALSSKRAYKDAYPMNRCMEIMEEGRGKHFDPEVLDAFFSQREKIIEIQIEHADT
ncbi:Response regulator [hydrothermal vent metagenome]|uniref:Response regulator n=1 Tax=hydrothermal vent metagenome TaxID=652676 RepID=A0A3B1DTI2_9ZZZZ